MAEDIAKCHGGAAALKLLDHALQRRCGICRIEEATVPALRFDRAPLVRRPPLREFAVRHEGAAVRGAQDGQNGVRKHRQEHQITWLLQKLANVAVWQQAATTPFPGTASASPSFRLGGQMEEWFRKFAHTTAEIVGRPLSFILAVTVIATWALTGSLFHYSDTWQLVINTGTHGVPHSEHPEPRCARDSPQARRAHSPDQQRSQRAAGTGVDERS